MAQKILSEIDIPLLDRAVAQRGYALVLGKPCGAPDRDVAAVLRRWRPGIRIRSSRVPEIAVASCAAWLTAALDAGAADAVSHPVDPFELAARVDVRVRSHMPGDTRIRDLYINRVHRTVTRAGIPIALGSLWGLLALVAMMPALIWRMVDEEAFLVSSLPGYAEYKQKVIRLEIENALLIKLLKGKI